MSPFQLDAPSRLHFGLLTWGPDAPRRFGGVGLMLDRPGLRLTATAADSWSARGPLADRVCSVAERVAGLLAADSGVPIAPLQFQIARAAPQHVGLGTGTQLSLGVARLVAAHAGRADLDVATLADLTGRGRRSGIGLHGFAQGGLIVDGGRRVEEGTPPLIARLAFPEDWHVLVVIPPGTPGLHGSPESEAFARLPPFSDAVADRLCRLVLLGLLPAVVERDLDAFGAALTAIQFHVGRAFAPAQGGPYAREDLEPIVDLLRDEGLVGVGQSSWGPTLYGFTQADPDARSRVLLRLADRFGNDASAAFWTQANPQGARLNPVADRLTEPSP